jgi:hypothetical protein
VCLRCYSGSRPCVYDSPNPRKRPEPFTFVNYAATVPAPFHHPGQDKLQMRAFTYFRERTAIELAGPIWQGSFFTGILLAIADSEPTVRHAVTALGALHETYGRTSTVAVPTFALSQYGKSIKGIVELETTEESVEVVLTSCILFALLESMRGFHHSSMSHLVAGLKVLRESQISGRFPSPQSSLLSRALQWLFIRADSQLMDVGGAEFGRSVQVYQPMEYFMPDYFHDIVESLFYIELLHNRVMYVLMRWEPIISERGYTASVTDGLEKDRDHYRGELARFHTAHQRMLESRFGPTSSEEHRAGHLAISLSSKVTAVLLEVDDFVNPEQDFDKSLGTFQAMVEESEQFINLSRRTNKTVTWSSDSPDGSTPQPVLTMSSGCVLPLYFVAARCRHSATRHKALQLLQNCKRREGLWDSDLAAGIAEKVISIEESKAKALFEERRLRDGTSSDALEMSAPSRELSSTMVQGLDVPDEARIRTVVMYYDRAEATGRAEFHKRPPWTVIPSPDNRITGVRSIEQVAFGTPGPRAVVTEVVVQT